MGIFEFLTFATTSLLRLGVAGWALNVIFFDGIEKGIFTMIKILVIYLCAEMAISGTDNYVRYRALLVRMRQRRAEAEAAELERQQAVLQFKAAQHEASEKYFDSRDMVLSQGKRTS